ncbi:hypothetical protein QMK19_37355 [Streptomyces sp. H10-C2]|uniref:hypothetical protein n=1 Tax=unclassified Streptomyces TaxID=2593676 RepID=UPI0024BA85EA|nr:MULTISPECIES: hypothetical protein [unclassified Streptomyces]MDJ0347327.1 hypothetical protein [Streptomyces sp. PH10-H1]MDJ0375124.1 hypothetical protein [Streptomyces sp. H10-C2]
MGAFGAGLALTFGASFGIGHVVGPTGSKPAPAHGHSDTAEQTPKDANDMNGTDHTATKSDTAPGGLQISERGYTLVPPAGPLPVGTATDFRFRITGPDGMPVTRYTRSHDKDLHLGADIAVAGRTPLTLLSTELELAPRRPRTAAELEQTLRAAAADTPDLADTLLTVGVQPFTGHGSAEVDLGRLVSGIVDRYRAAATATGTATSTAPGRVLPRADRHRAGVQRAAADAEGHDLRLADPHQRIRDAAVHPRLRLPVDLPRARVSRRR